MKEHWLKLKEWWSSLASREKRMLSAGGSLTALFILYQWIWSPYMDMVTGMREHIESQQKVLEFMRTADAEIARNQGNAHPKGIKTSPIILLSLLQKQIVQAGLAQSLQQLKQASNDSVAIAFKKVDFDKMINLLIATMKEQNVALAQMSVNSENAQGMVNANLVLKII
jgi:general secretion pathway protein M